MSEFVFPEVNDGDIVRVFFDRDCNSSRLAFVLKKKAHSIEGLVLTADGQLKQYPHCRHINDPWWADHPDKIGAKDAGYLFFDLSSDKKALLESKDTLAKVLKLVAEQSQTIAALAGRVDVLEAGAPRDVQSRPRKSA